MGSEDRVERPLVHEPVQIGPPERLREGYAPHPLGDVVLDPVPDLPDARVAAPAAFPRDGSARVSLDLVDQKGINLFTTTICARAW